MKEFIAKNKRELIISAIIGIILMVFSFMDLFSYGLYFFDIPILGTASYGFFSFFQLLILIPASLEWIFYSMVGIILYFILTFLEFTLISFGIIKLLKLFPKLNIIIKTIIVVAVLFAVFYMLGYLLRNSSEGTNNGGLNSCLNEYYSSKQKFTDEHSCIFNNLGSNPDSFKKITSFCEQAPSNPILLIKSDSPFGYEVIAKEKENERLRALPINVTVADYCFMTIAEKLLERDYQLGFLQKELGSENQTVLSVPIHLCKELGKTSSSSQKEQACYLYLLGTANIDTYVINADDKLKQSPYYTKWLSGLRELCQNLAEPKPTKCAVVPT